MNDFLQLMPGFLTAVQKLHNILSPVVLVLMFAGLTIKVVHAQLQGCLRSIWPFFVRMLAVSFLVGGLIRSGRTGESVKRLSRTVLPRYSKCRLSARRRRATSLLFFSALGVAGVE